MDGALAAESAAGLGGGAEGVALDVTDAAAVAEAAQRWPRTHGRIDILVNSAGIAGSNAPVVDYPVEEFHRIVAVNLHGTFHAAARSCGDGRRGYGRVVNIASVAGKEGNPNAGAYSASKAGDRADQVAGQGACRGRYRGQLRDPGGRPHPHLRPDEPERISTSCCRRSRAAGSWRWTRPPR
jgi:hypothetical protein